MTTEPARKPNGGSLKSLINSDGVRDQIARALPKHMTADRFLRVATTALLKTPKLAECTNETFVRSMLQCSELGLEPDGRRAYLIPYKTECTLLISYMGLIELGKRSGEILHWRAEVVCENDVFSMVNGIVHHEINIRSDRGKPIAVFSHVINRHRIDDFELMTMAEVESIRKRSKAANSGPWVTDFLEMAKKTVIRRHSKRLTLSPEFHRAIEIEDEREERNVTPQPMRSVFERIAAPQETEPEPPEEPEMAEADLKWGGAETEGGAL